MASDNLRAAPDSLSGNVPDRLIAFMDGPAKSAPRFIGLDMANGRDVHVEAVRVVDEDGAHKFVCLTEYPRASGTARKAPSAVSSGTATRRTARAHNDRQENGHDTRSPANPVANNKNCGGEAQGSSALSRSIDWIAERFQLINGASAFLKSRAILVTPVDRDARVRKYWVSGRRERQMAEDVIELAVSLGWEAR